MYILCWLRAEPPQPPSTSGERAPPAVLMKLEFGSTSNSAFSLSSLHVLFFVCILQAAVGFLLAVTGQLQIHEESTKTALYYCIGSKHPPLNCKKNIETMITLDFFFFFTKRRKGRKEERKDRKKEGKEGRKEERERTVPVQEFCNPGNFPPSSTLSLL